MASFCRYVYILCSTVCLIVIVVNHRNEYLFYYSHHRHGPSPTEFWSRAQARAQSEHSLLNIQKFKGCDSNRILFAFGKPEPI